MEYFIVENGKQAGPFTIAQLAERHIKSETLVWKEGMTDWTPAWKVAELKYILAETHQQTGPAVPPVPPTANQIQSQHNSLIFQSQKMKKKTKKVTTRTTIRNLRKSHRVGKSS